MSRLYLHACPRWLGQLEPYRYRGDSAKAHYWQTEESARSVCAVFRRDPLRIKLHNGSSYPGHNFQVEERAPGEYVVSFEVDDNLLAYAVRTTEPW
jgi:hypothetical protein